MGTVYFAATKYLLARYLALRETLPKNARETWVRVVGQRSAFASAQEAISRISGWESSLEQFAESPPKDLDVEGNPFWGEWGDCLATNLIHPLAAWELKNDEQSRVQRVRQLLRWTLEYWDAKDEHSTGPFWSESQHLKVVEDALGFINDDAIWEVLGKKLFCPADWIANAKAVRPILLSKTERLDPQVRELVGEVYRSFILGQWTACAALCRATLEHAIKTRAPSLGISLHWHGGRGDGSQGAGKSLESLIEETGARFPELVALMEEIRELGNRAMHHRKTRQERLAQSGGLVDAQLKFRAGALSGVRLQQCLERLFS